VAIRTWRKVAAVLDMDDNTLWNQRKRFGDTHPTPPWFRDEAEVVAWYAALRVPKPVEPVAAPKRKPLENGPIDPRAVARELTGRGPRRS
jgi:hypothetical protein